MPAEATPVALVTGAGRGIGRETALAFAAAGYRVVVNDAEVSLAGSPEASSASADVVAEIEVAGGIAMAFLASVTDEPAVEAMFAEVVARYGRIDVLVNNAGIVRDRMIVNMSVEDWDAVIGTTLRGSFLCSRAMVRLLKSQSRPGTVINVTSASGLFGNVGQANYSTAKAGIVGFTQTLAHETRRLGITCVAVSPWARTRMSDSIQGQSEDAKRRKAFLMSLDPRYIGSGIVAIAGADDLNLTGKVIGIRGRELIVFAQLGRAASGIAAEPGSPADFSAALDEVRTGLSVTRSAGEVFGYAPPI
jgi:NAD(P)-dependent dehydrogenase (short-subunit alcohol dehydrogenase family)